MCCNMHRCMHFDECCTEMMGVECVKGWNGVDTRAVGYSEQQIGFSF